MNKEGGYYCRGRQYGVEKKLAVGDYYENKKQLCGGQPNLMEIAREHKVSKKIPKLSTPMKYRITESTVDAELFAMEMEDAVASGFLQPGNVLVMDNAANYTGKENTILEDWLWNDHSKFALFLPARTPEWNPIELLWNCLPMRLKHNNGAMATATVQH